MFNSVNNPFNKRIESSTSSSGDKKRRDEDQKEQEKRLLEEEESDEVRIGGLPILTEDDVIYMTKSYIDKLKGEHSDRERVIEKLDKYLEKFDVNKFMKKNPNMTSSDFYMIMYNETEGIIK